MDELTDIFKVGLVCLTTGFTVYAYINNFFKDKTAKREFETKQNELDRRARELENVTNMEKVFDLMYDKKNRILIDEIYQMRSDFKTFQKETSDRLIDFLQKLKI